MLQKIKMIASILNEYGVIWTINRTLYLFKLKIMLLIPITEKLFERKVKVKRIDLFDFEVDRIKKFLINLPKEKQEEIIAIADKAIDGVIIGFSSIELDYGNPINWHYNPITKQECVPKLKWYKIPDFDEKIGDIKVIWEASRLTHFFYFTRAYLITGDKKYYKAFSDQLKHWLKNNPYSYGPNFKCGQECTLRMINTLMAYSVFDYYNLTTEEDKENVFKMVEVSYRKILSNFFYAHKCIKNNHTFSEICGLIVGAWCCENDRKLKRAYKLLDDEIKKQFTSDGGYMQYSFNYQRFTLQIFECVYKISEKTGMFISDKSENLIKNSVILMYQVQDITGDVPNYGSNDGALIFPLTVCGYRDFRPTLNTLYALITGNRLYRDGYYDEELLWFGSNKEYPIEEIKRISSAFYEAGLYTLRNEDGFIMVSLHDYKARPSHMDGLHIDLWYKGRNIFCDSGTYSYASEIANDMITTSGHNTVKIDGLEQMDKYGPFLIYSWTKCRDVKHSENKFSGTMISKKGYEHTREIIMKEKCYEVNDTIKGTGKECSILFHTPYEVKIIPDGFVIYDNDKKLCTVVVKCGDIKIYKSYRSLYYLRKEKINCVVVNQRMENKNICTYSWKIEFNE